MKSFPLQWPDGFARTHARDRKRGMFQTSFAIAREKLLFELHRMGATEIVITSNVPLRYDGLPDGNKKTVLDPGIAVYFRHRDQDKVFVCDKWSWVDDNLQAIRRTIDAFRDIERWGVPNVLERALAGFKALPESVSIDPWYKVLGVPKDADKELIMASYRVKAFRLHPDKGGTREEWDRLQASYEEGLKQFDKPAIADDRIK